MTAIETIDQEHDLRILYCPEKVAAAREIFVRFLKNLATVVFLVIYGISFFYAYPDLSCSDLDSFAVEVFTYLSYVPLFYILRLEMLFVSGQLFNKPEPKRATLPVKKLTVLFDQEMELKDTDDNEAVMRMV
ncbi:hypothetical protein SBRCBS47491_008882 [Sporothrix bragantina]|uniref:Uncharacterized protein n=1 Tax=Sporothrix bragantina TaxID=671064 RepID=A0ABP0CRP9_9PEZI